MERLNLTEDSDVLYHLLQVRNLQEVNMKGQIKTKEKCPRCNGKFKHFPKIGFICEYCKTTPRRFYIDLHWQGKRFKIYSSKHGTALDSYQIAQATLLIINEEIRKHIFDPTKYIKSEIKKFFVSYLIEEYYEKKKSSIAPSYLPTFKKHLDTAKSFFTTKDIRELRKIDLEKYKDSLNSQNKSPKTVKNYLDTFKAFLNYCKDTLEIINIVPSFPKVEKPQPKIQWVDTDIQRLIYNYIPEQDKPIILFLMLTGCRPAEARALKVKDINLKQGFIAISSSFSRNVLRPKRKGKNAPPVIVPIHPELKPILELCIKDKLPEAFVFINPRTGKPYSQEAMGRIWNTTRKKLNLPENLRLYDVTRHSFASNLINNGVPIADISKLLGHTNINTTTKYAHIDLQRTKVALNSISLFNNERKQIKNN